MPKLWNVKWLLKPINQTYTYICWQWFNVLQDDNWDAVKYYYTNYNSIAQRWQMGHIDYVRQDMNQAHRVSHWTN